MPETMLPDGTWVHQTWEELEAEVGAERVKEIRTPMPDPATMTEGERSLYHRMQAEGEASAALWAAGLSIDDLRVEGDPE